MTSQDLVQLILIVKTLLAGRLLHIPHSVVPLVERVTRSAVGRTFLIMRSHWRAFLIFVATVIHDFLWCNWRGGHGRLCPWVNVRYACGLLASGLPKKQVSFGTSPKCLQDGGGGENWAADVDYDSQTIDFLFVRLRIRGPEGGNGRSILEFLVSFDGSLGLGEIPRFIPVSGEGCEHFEGFFGGKVGIFES